MFNTFHSIIDTNAAKVYGIPIMWGAINLAIYTVGSKSVFVEVMFCAVRMGHGHWSMENVFYL